MEYENNNKDSAIDHSMPTKRSKVNWDELEDELNLVPYLLSSTFQSSTNFTDIELFDNLNDSIVHSAYYLLRGFPLETEILKNIPVVPWSSGCLLRTHILAQVLSLNGEGKTPPVILVTESAPGKRYFNNGGGEEDEDVFLSSWEFCRDKARLCVIDNASALSNIETILFYMAKDKMFNTPGLLVMNVSSDSFASSNLHMIRKKCNQYGFILCVEGPGLAMMAQLNIPSDPCDCLALADLLIVDFASWFGINGCSVVSFQNSFEIGSTILQFPHLKPPAFTLDQLNESLIPTVKLWSVLSKIGVENIRSMVDELTSLSESFVHFLGTSSNLKVSYEGVGCVVRISYVSRMHGDRLPSNLKSINKAILSGLEEEASRINILIGENGESSFYQFSPIRLLTGTSIPSRAEIEHFTEGLQFNANKFETCQIGRPAFVSRVTKCASIQMIDENESINDGYLSYGCFRVVPKTFRETWRMSTTQKGQVEYLTKSLAAELCLHLEYSRNANIERYGDVQLANGQCKESNNLGLPVLFYFYSEMDNVVCYISAEPKAAVSPTNSFKQAKNAAEFMLSAAQQVMVRWNQDAENMDIEIQQPAKISQLSSTDSYYVTNNAQESNEATNKGSNRQSERYESSNCGGEISEASCNEISESEYLSARSGKVGDALTNWMLSRQTQGFSPLKKIMARLSVKEENEDDKSDTYIEETDSFMQGIVVGDYGPPDPAQQSYYTDSHPRSEIPTHVSETCSSVSELKCCQLTKHCKLQETENSTIQQTCQTCGLKYLRTAGDGTRNLLSRESRQCPQRTTLCKCINVDGHSTSAGAWHKSSQTPSSGDETIANRERELLPILPQILESKERSSVPERFEKLKGSPLILYPSGHTFCTPSKIGFSLGSQHSIVASGNELNLDSSCNVEHSTCGVDECQVSGDNNLTQKTSTPLFSSWFRSTNALDAVENHQHAESGSIEIGSNGREVVNDKQERNVNEDYHSCTSIDTELNETEVNILTFKCPQNTRGPFATIRHWFQSARLLITNDDVNYPSTLDQKFPEPSEEVNSRASSSANVKTGNEMSKCEEMGDWGRESESTMGNDNLVFSSEEKTGSVDRDFEQNSISTNLQRVTQRKLITAEVENCTPRYMSNASNDEESSDEGHDDFESFGTFMESMESAYDVDQRGEEGYEETNIDSDSDDSVRSKETADPIANREGRQLSWRIGIIDWLSQIKITSTLSLLNRLRLRSSQAESQPKPSKSVNGCGTRIRSGGDGTNSRTSEEQSRSERDGTSVINHGVCGSEESSESENCTGHNTCGSHSPIDSDIRTQSSHSLDWPRSSVGGNSGSSWSNFGTYDVRHR